MTHSSKVSVVKEAPLSEDSVIAEGAVVMAIVGHHPTETVLCRASLTHHSVEDLEREGEREKWRERGMAVKHTNTKWKF